MPRPILPTQVRVGWRWIDVDRIEMDLAIMLDPQSGTAREPIPMGRGTERRPIVMGREGIRVIPLTAPARSGMCSGSWSRRFRPSARMAMSLRTLRSGCASYGIASSSSRPGAKVLLAGGPAIIHSGGREPLTWLIESGLHPCVVLRQCTGRA